MYDSLDVLNRKIVVCDKCPRLVMFRRKIANERRRQFRNFNYWGKPITGFGDPNARLVVIGLAPAAHGGNRTGRVFTGDNSARFLVKHLHQAGFANQPTSDTRDDGLSYRDCYVTAAVRCVPPDNKPSKSEIYNCSIYLQNELRLLVNAKVVLALGRIAFETFVNSAKEVYEITGSFKFEHGGVYRLSEKLPVVIASYHPSPRNTNTGKLTSSMFRKVLSKVHGYLGSNDSPSLTYTG